MKSMSFLSRQAIVALMLFVLTGCGALDKGDKIVNEAIQKASTALDDAIDALQSSSADWQQVLKGLESKLTEDAQKTIRNEVQNVVSRTIAQAGVEFRCDVDFINKRIAEDLMAIKARVLHQSAPPAKPAFCQVVPEAVDRAAVPDHVKVLSFYGYNFDFAKGLHVRLVNTDGSATEVTGMVNHPTPYAMTVIFGATGVKLDEHSQRFTLEWDGAEVSTVGIIQPATPVCESKVVSIFLEDSQRTIGPLAPGHVGKGDAEFNGNGPDVNASVTLTTSPQQIIARLYMDAKETRSDWTQVQGFQDYMLYQVEPGWKISRIEGVPNESHVHYLDKTTGNKDWPTTPMQISMGPGDLVERYDIIGDTAGNDVGRTSVKIRFNPIHVSLMKVADCVPATALHNIMTTGLISAVSNAKLAEATRQKLSLNQADLARLQHH